MKEKARAKETRGGYRKETRRTQLKFHRAEERLLERMHPKRLKSLGTKVSEVEIQKLKLRGCEEGMKGTFGACEVGNAEKHESKLRKIDGGEKQKQRMIK